MTDFVKLTDFLKKKPDIRENGTIVDILSDELKGYIDEMADLIVDFKRSDLSTIELHKRINDLDFYLTVKRKESEADYE